MEQKLREIQKNCSKWQQKYNTLLEKNQNDLIKIRVRQKQLNETIGKLENEKQKMKEEFQTKIQLLENQIGSLKNGNHKDKFKNTNQVKSSENHKISEQAKKQLIQNEKIQIKELEQTIIKYEKKIQELEKEKQANKAQILNLRNYNQSNSARDAQIKISNSLKQTQRRGEQQRLFSEVQRLRQLLTLTNTQYKNLLHKQQLKEKIIVQKNDQLNLMTQQLIDMQQEIQKYKPFEMYKVKFDEEQRRKEQLEQENLLMKQMLKSHKTMIKIKDNQINRLKEKVKD